MILLEDFAKFLIEYMPLVKDLIEALTMGVDQDVIRKSIQDAKVAASDAAMKAQLGLPQ